MKGFQAYETVNLSWNANGGQSLGSFTAASDGSLSTYVTPPFAPLGSYIVTATGSSSNIQATNVLAVGPGILLSALNVDTGGINQSGVNPGGILNVNGGGFTRGETVVIHAPPALLFTTVADSSGSFNIQITAPTHYNPKIADFVYANSTTGTDKAKAAIQFVPPQIALNYNGGSAPFGVTFPVSGQGFLAGEHVSLYFDYQTPVKNGSAFVATDGTFAAEIKIPSISQFTFSLGLTAEGVTSKVQANTSIAPVSGIYTNPAIGHLGTMITIYGGSFYANEQVTVMFGQYTESPVTTDANGAFSLSFVAPTTTEGGGFIFVYATDGRYKAYNWFLIPSTLHITPNTGSAGTKIAVIGTFFQANFPYTVAWFDPVSGSLTTLGSVTTDNYGNLSATVNVPANVVHGHTYHIVILGSSFTNANSATFTAQ